MRGRNVRHVDKSFSLEPIREDQEAEEEAGSFSPQLFHGDENEEAIDPEEDRAMLWKHMSDMTVLEEQQRRIQEAMASKPAPSEDNFEMEALEAMGAMEDGDVAAFGFGAEVNLDSQTKAPTYTIEKDGSNGETCIIRFHAGPPYADINGNILIGKVSSARSNVEFSNFKRHHYRR